MRKEQFHWHTHQLWPRSKSYTAKNGGDVSKQLWDRNCGDRDFTSHHPFLLHLNGPRSGKNDGNGSGKQGRALESRRCMHPSSGSGCQDHLPQIFVGTCRTCNGNASNSMDNLWNLWIIYGSNKDVFWSAKHLFYAWLVVSTTPLKNMSSSIGFNWDDDIPNWMGK